MTKLQIIALTCLVLAFIYFPNALSKTLESGDKHRYFDLMTRAGQREPNEYSQTYRTHETPEKNDWIQKPRKHLKHRKQNKNVPNKGSHSDVYEEKPMKMNYCGFNTQHTMCRFRPGRSANCKGTGYFNLTKSEKQQIVKRHNDLRKSLSLGFGTQPIAEPRLPLLEWNSTLADIAQRWADQCVFEHDVYRHLGPDGFKDRVGQNIAYVSRSENPHHFDVHSLLQMWIDESKELAPQFIQKLESNSGGVLHYTQMVWRKTTQIGCGGSVYEDHYRGRVMNKALLVCNYYPSGNIIDQPVY